MMKRAMNQLRIEVEDERFPAAAEDAPFLPPIEKPSGMMMKMVYFLSRRKFGERFTPIKVFGARMPPAFGQLYGKVYSLDKKLTLPRETVMLIRERVASINVCRYCMDANRYYVIKASMNEKKVNPSTFARLARSYSERAICEIVWLVASEHVSNLTNIGLNIHSDMLCQ